MSEQVMIELLRREFSEVYHERSTTDEAIARITAAFAPYQPVSAQPAGEVPSDAWQIAQKVREDLDRLACPNVWMVIAYESVLKHNRIVAALQARAVVLPECDVVGMLSMLVDELDALNRYARGEINDDMAEPGEETELCDCTDELIDKARTMIERLNGKGGV